MDSRKFGNVIRKVIEERGLKYSYVADKIGCSKQLLYAKTLGDCAWKLDEASKVMKVLDLPIDILEK